MLFLENLEFLLVMKVLSGVFVIAFDVWTCIVLWEATYGCGGDGCGWNRALFGILIAFGCLKLCADA